MAKKEYDVFITTDKFSRTPGHVEVFVQNVMEYFHGKVPAKIYHVEETDMKNLEKTVKNAILDYEKFMNKNRNEGLFSKTINSIKSVFKQKGMFNENR